jgi:hypothetical protein
MTDEKMIDRITALLAKAEATQYPEEAEAFFAKAAELMEKYRIDPAQFLQRSSEIVRMSYQLNKHKFLRASLALLNAVGRHYGVIVLISSTGNSKLPTLCGEQHDIESMLMMFGSLIIQRDRAALREQVPYGVSQTSFRNSFCYGYAIRVAERLKAIRDAAKKEAVTEGNAMALEVYGQLEKVEAALGGNLGSSSHNRPSLNSRGAGRGYEEGGSADLGGTRVGGGDGRRAIGR